MYTRPAENKGFPYCVRGNFGKKTSSREARSFIHDVEDGLAVEVQNVDVRMCVKSNIPMSDVNAKALMRIMNTLTWLESCDNITNTFESFRVNCLRASPLKEVK